MPLGATPRVLPPSRPEPHLSLVDNVGIGDTIINEAQRLQEASLAAPAVKPLRASRRARNGAQRPHLAPVVVSHINPVAKRLALLAANGDWTRCQIIDAETVLVHNHPIRAKKVKNAGRSGNVS